MKRPVTGRMLSPLSYKETGAELGHFTGACSKSTSDDFRVRNVSLPRPQAPV